MSKSYKSLIKYYNFTNNKDIPLIDKLVFVFDIDIFNLYMSNFLSNEFRFIEKDYWDDTIIVYECNDNYNNTFIGYVLVLEKTNSTINFFLENIKFKERRYRSIVLFIPEQKNIKNSLTKPYFKYFPYFFGEHDNNIKIKNKFFHNYFDIKCVFCLGSFDHLNLEILELEYNKDKNEQKFKIIKNIK